MVKTIVPATDEKHLDEAVDRFLSARKPVALTGAGISVESGIPDFRSPGGLWTVMAPEEYATLQVFVDNPGKAWKLYRAIAETIEGAEPNQAHKTLAKLERVKKLSGVITQNVDGLHQAAGSRNVIEMHGDHQHLQCIQCSRIGPASLEFFTSSDIPQCKECSYPLKPNVVLFGEAVRGVDAIETLLSECDLLMVIGTSAQVYPAAGLPFAVKQKGGMIFEFNTESTTLTLGQAGPGFANFTLTSPVTTGTDYLFQGEASKTLRLFEKRLLDS